MFLVKKIKRNYISQACYKIIIMRHGQSQWNKVKKWAGWTDIKLSGQGIIQSRECGNLLKAKHIQIDQAYTSLLTRNSMDLHYIPVTKTWRLNEKNYGALQGQNKPEMSLKYGENKVKQWRRSLDIRPPPLQVSDPRHPINDRRYKYIAQQLPSSECLLDVVERMRPLTLELCQKMRRGRRMIVITHGNVIRAYFRILFGMNQQQLSKLNFPNATPVVINFDSNLNAIRYQIIGDKFQILKKMQNIENQAKVH